MEHESIIDNELDSEFLTVKERTFEHDNIN